VSCEKSQQRYVVMDDPYFDAKDASMQFRLTYEGQLLSNGHAQHKQEIRKRFHPQLRRLWEITPSLLEMKYPPLNLVEVGYTPGRSRIEYLADQFSRNNYNFVPLVTRDLDVSFCGIDVLFLRPDPPGSVLSKSDIDNRLKTLFDALRMPEGKAELGGYDFPADNEKPFYSLLEDDALVTKVSVETDFLLEPIGADFDKNDSRLIITVTLQPAIARLDLRFRAVNFGFRSGKASPL
jgi:hypothetical protein